MKKPPKSHQKQEFRYLRLKDLPCSIPKKRIPCCVDKAQLEGAEIAGNEKPEPREEDHRYPLIPGRWIMAPTGWNIRAFLSKKFDSGLFCNYYRKCNNKCTYQIII